jgi:hypothetical protein
VNPERIPPLTLQYPFGSKFPGKYCIRVGPVVTVADSAPSDWTTATSMVVLVFVRVRTGASAQLSGALSGDQYTSSADYNA